MDLSANSYLQLSMRSDDMETQPATRRLAAVIVADAVAYSQMMAQDVLGRTVCASGGVLGDELVGRDGVGCGGARAPRRGIS